MFPNESGLCAQSLLIIMKSNAVNHNKLVGGGEVELCDRAMASWPSCLKNHMNSR